MPSDDTLEARSRGYYLECPHCRHELRLRLSDSGRQIHCQLCGEGFRFDPLDPQASIQAVYVQCPHCDDELRAAVKYLGVRVGCRRCGEPLLIPGSIPRGETRELEEAHDLAELGLTFDAPNEPQVARELSDLELTLDDNHPSAPRAGTERPSDAIVTAPASDAHAGDDVENLEPLQTEFQDDSPEEVATAELSVEEAEESWYCELLGQKLGPMSLDDLKFMAEHGELSRDDRVMQGEAGDWRPAGEVVDKFSQESAADSHQPVARETHGLFHVPPAGVAPKSPSTSPDTVPDKTSQTPNDEVETPSPRPAKQSQDSKTDPRTPAGRQPASADPQETAEQSKPDETAATPSTTAPQKPPPQTPGPQVASKPSPPTTPSAAAPVQPPTRVPAHSAAQVTRRPHRRGVELRSILWPDATWIRVAIIAIALSPVLAWGGRKLMHGTSDRPDLQFENNTFDQETPTPVVLMAMLIKSDAKLSHNGRSWKLTPLSNVVLDELGDKDADGYRTAVVSFDRVDGGDVLFHATVRMTYKLLELKMQGDLVVRADYDVKSVEKLSTAAAK